MKRVEPKVFLVAYTEMNDEAVKAWLDHVGGLKVLDYITGDPGEQSIELAGRNCYRSFDVGLNPNISKVRTDSEEYHGNILKSAHGSVLEHATCSFAFEDVSRVFCYSDDTEVLTDEGWKKWPDVRGDEKFATISSGRLFFEKPEQYFCKDYEGDMYVVESEQVSLKVTPNHRMWVQLADTQKARRGEESFGIKLAEEIVHKRVRYQKGDVQWIGKRPEVIEIPATHRSWSRSDMGTETQRTYNARPYDAMLFARLLGYYLSEGTLSKHDAAIRLYQNPGPVYTKMLDTLHGLGFSVTDTSSGYGVGRKLAFNDVSLRDWLDKHCGNGALNKKVPDIVHGWSSDLISEFVDAYIEGDGNVHCKNRHRVAYTVSRQLADDLQILALKMGLSANIRIDDRVGQKREMKTGQVFENKNPCYIVSFLSLSRQYPYVNHNVSSKINNRWLRSNGYMDDLEPYNGKIYCVKVPSSGLLYVRRNGKPCWCGNTHELVRHRAGMAFSQVSLRYVRLDDLSFWIPDIIANNPEAMAVFEEVIEKCEWGQKELAKIYSIDEMKNFHQKKQLTSAFRRIAPIGLATGIYTSFNLRSLRWVIQMRTAAGAEVEIRKVFYEVYKTSREKWPYLFQDFVEVEGEDGIPECKPDYNKV